MRLKEHVKIREGPSHVFSRDKVDCLRSVNGMRRTLSVVWRSLHVALGFRKHQWEKLVSSAIVSLVIPTNRTFWFCSPWTIYSMNLAPAIGIWQKAAFSAYITTCTGGQFTFYLFSYKVLQAIKCQTEMHAWILAECNVPIKGAIVELSNNF